MSNPKCKITAKIDKLEASCELFIPKQFFFRALSRFESVLPLRFKLLLIYLFIWLIFDARKYGSWRVHGGTVLTFAFNI